MSAAVSGSSVPSPLFRMADRLVKGRLVERMEALRTEGRSFAEIARLLYAEGGIEVSPETLRAWVRKLGIDGEAA